MSKKKFYDDMYEDNVSDLDNPNPSVKKKIDFFKKNVGKKKKILELAGGSNLYFRKYSKNNEIYLLDISSNVIKNAKPFIKEGKLCDFDKDKIPYPDNYFDIVVAGEIIEHLFFPKHFVDEIHRVLKKKGTFLGSCPNFFNYRRRIEYLLGINNESPINSHHIRFFNLYYVKKLLSEKFEIVEIVSSSKFNIFKSLLAGGFIWKCKKR